jgi:hypothetical protein
LEDFGTPIEELKISGWSKKANQRRANGGIVN